MKYVLTESRDCWEPAVTVH